MNFSMPRSTHSWGEKAGSAAALSCLQSMEWFWFVCPSSALIVNLVKNSWVVFTVVVKVWTCIFGNRKPLLNAAIWKEEGMRIDFFYFPVASVLFLFFLNRKLLYYRVMYALLGLKIAIWNLAEIEARGLLDKLILFLQFKMKFRDRDHTTWLGTGLLCAEMLNTRKCSVSIGGVSFVFTGWGASNSRGITRAVLMN